MMQGPTQQKNVLRQVLLWNLALFAGLGMAGWAADSSALLANAILFSLFLFSLAMVLTLVRLFKGPSAQDRVLALDYLYILAMLMMLTLGIRYASDTYFEAALLIALFGFVGSFALAKFLLRGEVIE